MVSKRYSILLVACMASSWSYAAYSAEAATVSAEAPAVSAEAAAVPAEAAAIDEKASSMQLAPVRSSVGGNVGYAYQRQTVGASKYMMQSLNTVVNMAADSFIWQPWLATLNGNLDISASKFTNSSSDYDNRVASVSATGKAALNLVPRSRFPFGANYSRSDSRVGSGLGGLSGAGKNTSYGLSQSYRPLSEDASYSVGYNHSLSEGAASADKQDTWNISTTHQFTDQNLAIYGVSTNIERMPSNDSSANKSLVANHSYRPKSLFLVDTLASVVKADYHLASTDLGNSSAQLSSNGSWRTSDNILNVNGGMRFAESESYDNLTTSPQARSANANIGASYALSRRTSLYGSANINQNYSGGTRVGSTFETVGASYIADAISLGAYSYNWNVSGGGINQNGGGVGSVQRVYLHPTHGANRSIELGGGWLAIGASQNLSLEKGNKDPYASRLTESGSIAWNRSEDQRTTLLGMNVSDSRSLRGTRDFYQMINLQASISKGVSSYGSVSGNLTIQRIRQGDDASATTVTTANATAGAGMTYRNSRAFGVPRLLFTSDLQISGNKGGQSLAALVSEGTQVGSSWENRLEYSIGLLQAKLGLRLAEVSHTSQSLLYFNFIRVF